MKRILVLVCTALALAACGGATPSSESATSAPVAATSAPAAAAGPTSAAAVPAAAADCTSVTTLDPASAEATTVKDNLQAALQATGGNNTIPTVTSIQALSTAGDWVLVQADFDNAEPGVFLLQKQASGYGIAAVWGGIVETAGEVQQYLSEQAPSAPKALFACFPLAEPFTTVN